MVAPLLELNALLTFWLCLTAWQRDRTARGRRLFMSLCAAVFLWSAGNLARVHGPAASIEALRLAYLGIVLVPGLCLGLALVMRGARIAERSAWALSLLLAPGLLCYALLFRPPELASLFIAVDPAGETRYGVAWWLFAGYAWVVAGLACFQLAMSARRLRGRSDSLRRIALAVGSLVTLAANAVYATTGIPGLDLTPMLLGAWLVALRSELLSGDFLQVLPVTQHDLLSQLPMPLILTDLNGRVTEINPAAQNSLGIAKADALDRNIEALLEGAAFAPRFERWSLVAAGREAGSMLLPASRKPVEDA